MDQTGSNGAANTNLMPSADVAGAIASGPAQGISPQPIAQQAPAPAQAASAAPTQPNAAADKSGKLESAVNASEVDAMEVLNTIHGKIDDIIGRFDTAEKAALRNGAISGSIAGAISGGIISVGMMFARHKLGF